MTVVGLFDGVNEGILDRWTDSLELGAYDSWDNRTNNTFNDGLFEVDNEGTWDGSFKGFKVSLNEGRELGLKFGELEGVKLSFD